MPHTHDVLEPRRAAAAHPPAIGDPTASAPDPTRRQVLKVVGVGAASLAVAGTGAASYRVFDSAALDLGGGHAYDPWRHWRDTPGALGAVGAAILAADPHNTQPWTFRLTERTVDVSVDPARTIGSVDPYLREQHVGLGCALENLALACRARGLQPAVTLMPDGPTGGRVAHVDLAPAPAARSELYDAIGSRHIDRGPYDDQQSRDGFAWFRGSNDAVQQHRDGLTLDAQGLSPLVLAVGKLLPASSRSAGDAFWVRQTHTVHTRTAAAYGVITAADPDHRTTQLRAGRLLQRIHPAATARGIALQHMNQVTERMDAEPAPAGRGGHPVNTVGMSTRRDGQHRRAARLGVAGSALRVLAVGAVGGVALVAAAWLGPAHARFVALVLVGTVPAAALAWTAVVPAVLLLVAGAIAFNARAGVRTAPRGAS